MWDCWRKISSRSVSSPRQSLPWGSSIYQVTICSPLTLTRCSTLWSLRATAYRSWTFHGTQVSQPPKMFKLNSRRNLLISFVTRRHFNISTLVEWASTNRLSSILLFKVCASRRPSLLCTWVAPSQAMNSLYRWGLGSKSYESVIKVAWTKFNRQQLKRTQINFGGKTQLKVIKYYLKRKNLLKSSNIKFMNITISCIRGLGNISKKITRIRCWWRAWRSMTIQTVPVLIKSSDKTASKPTSPTGLSSNDS